MTQAFFHLLWWFSENWWQMSLNDNMTQLGLSVSLHMDFQHMLCFPSLIHSCWQNPASKPRTHISCHETFQLQITHEITCVRPHHAPQAAHPSQPATGARTCWCKRIQRCRNEGRSRDVRWGQVERLDLDSVYLAQRRKVVEVDAGRMVDKVDDLQYREGVRQPPMVLMDSVD